MFNNALNLPDASLNLILKEPLSPSAIFDAIVIIDIAWWSEILIAFTVSCVPKSLFNYFLISSFKVISFVLTCSK